MAFSAGQSRQQKLARRRPAKLQEMRKRQEVQTQDAGWSSSVNVSTSTWAPEASTSAIASTSAAILSPVGDRPTPTMTLSPPSFPSSSPVIVNGVEVVTITLTTTVTPLEAHTNVAIKAVTTQSSGDVTITEADGDVTAIPTVRRPKNSKATMVATDAASSSVAAPLPTTPAVPAPAATSTPDVSAGLSAPSFAPSASDAPAPAPSSPLPPVAAVDTAVPAVADATVPVVAATPTAPEPAVAPTSSTEAVGVAPTSAAVKVVDPAVLSAADPVATAADPVATTAAVAEPATSAAAEVPVAPVATEAPVEVPAATTAAPEPAATLAPAPIIADTSSAAEVPVTSAAPAVAATDAGVFSPVASEAVKIVSVASSVEVAPVAPTSAAVEAPAATTAPAVVAPAPSSAAAVTTEEAIFSPETSVVKAVSLTSDLLPTLAATSASRSSTSTVPTTPPSAATSAATGTETDDGRVFSTDDMQTNAVVTTLSTSTGRNSREVVMTLTFTTPDSTLLPTTTPVPSLVDGNSAIPSPSPTPFVSTSRMSSDEITSASSSSSSQKLITRTSTAPDGTITTIITSGESSSFFGNISKSPASITLTALVAAGIFALILAAIAFIVRRMHRKRSKRLGLVLDSEDGGSPSSFGDSAEKDMSLLHAGDRDEDEGFSPRGMWERRRRRSSDMTEQSHGTVTGRRRSILAVPTLPPIIGSPFNDDNSGSDGASTARPVSSDWTSFTGTARWGTDAGTIRQSRDYRISSDASQWSAMDPQLPPGPQGLGRNRLSSNRLSNRLSTFTQRGAHPLRNVISATNEEQEIMHSPEMHSVHDGPYPGAARPLPSFGSVLQGQTADLTSLSPRSERSPRTVADSPRTIGSPRIEYGAKQSPSSPGVLGRMWGAASQLMKKNMTRRTEEDEDRFTHFNRLPRDASSRLQAPMTPRGAATSEGSRYSMNDSQLSLSLDPFADQGPYGDVSPRTQVSNQFTPLQNDHRLTLPPTSFAQSDAASAYSADRAEVAQASRVQLAHLSRTHPSHRLSTMTDATGYNGGYSRNGDSEMDQPDSPSSSAADSWRVAAPSTRQPSFAPLPTSDIDNDNPFGPSATIVQFARPQSPSLKSESEASEVLVRPQPGGLAPPEIKLTRSDTTKTAVSSYWSDTSVDNSPATASRARMDSVFSSYSIGAILEEDSAYDGLNGVAPSEEKSSSPDQGRPISIAMATQTAESESHQSATSDASTHASATPNPAERERRASVQHMLLERRRRSEVEWM